MQFVRKKKRGQNQKVRRTWFSGEGYRIIWRKEVHDVRVPARFQACVRTLIPDSGGELRQMWDFVNHKRRLTKTLQAAQDECEKHKCLWTKACQAGGIRALKELFGGKVPMGLPLWARKKMDRRLYAILTDNRPMKYRDDEEDESCTESSQPASGAPDPGSPARISDSSASPTEAANLSTPRTRNINMAKARTRQTDNRVSMEEATSLGGRRKALAARRSKTELAALREDLQAQAKTKGSQAKAKIAGTLKKTAAKGKDKIPPTALRLINPTYLGMDVIPEKIADGLKKNPRL
jgi:hypothetical protein